MRMPTAPLPIFRDRVTNNPESLHEFLYGDTRYAAGEMVLVVGDGDGVQTVRVARQSPGAHILAVDASAQGLISAQHKVQAARLKNVVFQQVDLTDLPFAEQTFDHVFACFALGRIPRPDVVLGQFGKVLKMSGTITVVEGDHGSMFLYPPSAAAQRVVAATIELRARGGEDATIGRSLYPLLQRAGFCNIRVVPKVVYRDEKQNGVPQQLAAVGFFASVQAAADDALGRTLLDKESWTQGIVDLRKAADPGGTFTYTYFRALAEKPRANP